MKSNTLTKSSFGTSDVFVPALVVVLVVEASECFRLPLSTGWFYQSIVQCIEQCKDSMLFQKRFTDCWDNIIEWWMGFFYIHPAHDIIVVHTGWRSNGNRHFDIILVKETPLPLSPCRDKIVFFSNWLLFQILTALIKFPRWHLVKLKFTFGLQIFSIFHVNKNINDKFYRRRALMSSSVRCCKCGVFTFETHRR
jgi:hypothetical protein